MNMIHRPAQNDFSAPMTAIPTKAFDTMLPCKTKLYRLWQRPIHIIGLIVQCTHVMNQYTHSGTYLQAGQR